MHNVDNLLFGGEPTTPMPGSAWAGREVPGNALMSPAGRVFYAHSSGNGFVMCWNDNGTHRQTFVAKSSYVSSGTKYSSGGGPTGNLPYWNSSPAPNNKVPIEWASLTDAQLYSAFLWHDPNTSQYNTTVQINTWGSNYAAGACRSVSISDPILGSFSCDLPNFQTLCRIWLDIGTIASVMSSESSYWSGWLDGGQAWTSTEYSDGDVEDHQGKIQADGGCGGVWRGYNNSKRRCLPVHDIATLIVS